MVDVLSINRTPKDFVAKTRHLSLEERGAYQEILDQIVIIGQNCDPCSLPDDDRFIANLCGTSLKKWQAIKPRLCDGQQAVLVVEGGRISQTRIVEEIEAARLRIESSSKAGVASGEARRKLRERMSNGRSTDVRTVARTGVQREGQRNGNAGATQSEPVTSHEESKSLPQQSRGKHAGDIASSFAGLWSLYPRKLGKDDALRHFSAQSKKTAMPELVVAIEGAIRNYLRDVEIRPRDHMHGSRFFLHGWHDFADGTWKEPDPPHSFDGPPKRPGPALAPHHPPFTA